MSGVVAAVGSHRRVVGRTFGNEHFRVLAVLDALQGVAHGSTGLGVDHLRTGYVLTVFGIVGDGVVHVGDAAFVHQVDDQLQLVQALEVGHFRRVTGFDQGFETGLDQLDATTAENGLLTEQVGFGLVLEGGFDDTGTTAADAAGVGQGDVLGVAGSVLVDGDQVRDATALDELGTHGVTRGLRRDHDHVEVGARDDLVVVDGEAVSEGQGGALLQVRLDLFLVQAALELVRGEDHDHVGCGDGGLHVGNLQTVRFGLGHGGGAATQAHGDVDAGVLQVAGMGVALGAVADDGNFLALDDREVTVFIVENAHGNSPSVRPRGPAFSSDAQSLVATGDASDATADHFQDRRSADGLDEAVQFVAGTRQLHGIDATGDVDDLPTEDIGGALDLGALGARGLDLHQHQLALDMGAFRQVHQLDHFDQLVEVLGDLLDHLIVPHGGQRQTRQGRVLGRRHGQAFDVVVALGEQADHAGQCAWLVFQQQGNDVSHDQVRSVLLSHMSRIAPSRICIG